MTLKLIIQSVTSFEIKFLGDADNLNQIKNILSKRCTIEEENSLEWEDSTLKVYPAFTISIFNLYKSIQDQTVAQIILKYIDDKIITAYPRDRYLLQYWDYEAKMIVEGKSKYKSFNNYDCNHLSSPILLKAILNECEKKNYLPGFMQLFQFLENSEKAKIDYLNQWLHFDKSFTLDLNEAQQFIEKNENNLSDNGADDKIYGKFQLLLFDKQLTKIYEDYAPEAQNKLVR